MSTTGRRRVLVADDDATSIDVLAGCVRAEGCEVTTVRSAFEAQAVLGAEPVDVLMPSLQLPGGPALARRSASTGSTAPAVIVTTGAPSLHSAIAMLRAQAVDYLVKPLARPQVPPRSGAPLPAGDSGRPASASTG